MNDSVINLFFNSPISFTLIATTVLVSVFAFSNNEIKEKGLFSPFEYHKNKKWWLLITHGFLHADFFHLFFNVYVLYVFGPSIESYFNDSSEIGSFYFISFYLGAMIFATLPSIIKHNNNPMYKSLGASGAISAIVFAYILIYPLNQLGLLIIPGLWLPGFIFGALYLVAEHFLSKKQYSNVAHDAHISGSIFGVLFIIIYDFNNLITFFRSVSNYFVDLMN
jgi:membrane associated rhomboid family serine protease